MKLTRLKKIETVELIAFHFLLSVDQLDKIYVYYKTVKLRDEKNNLICSESVTVNTSRSSAYTIVMLHFIFVRFCL